MFNEKDATASKCHYVFDAKPYSPSNPGRDNGRINMKTLKINCKSWKDQLID